MKRCIEFLVLAAFCGVLTLAITMARPKSRDFDFADSQQPDVTQTQDIQGDDEAEEQIRQAFTVWWIIWNHPELCLGPMFDDGLCSFDDFGTPGVDVAVLYATGQTANPGEPFMLVASMYETSEEFMPGPRTDPFGFGEGLQDASEAEILVIVRSHGDTLPGMVDDQVTLFLEPGCQDLGGPNVCVDIQTAVLPAGSDKVVNPLYTLESVGDGTFEAVGTATLIRSEDAIQLIIRTSAGEGDDEGDDDEDDD
jgi:hypothetical protein